MQPAPSCSLGHEPYSRTASAPSLPYPMNNPWPQRLRRQLWVHGERLFTKTNCQNTTCVFTCTRQQGGRSYTTATASVFFVFFLKKEWFFLFFFFREKVEFNFQAYAFLNQTVSRSRTFRKGRRERFMLHFVAQYYFRGPRKHLVHKMELRKNIRSWSLLCCETNSLTWKPRNGFGITQFPYYYHNYF